MAARWFPASFGRWHRTSRRTRRGEASASYGSLQSEVKYTTRSLAIPSKQASSDSTMFMSNPFAELSASVPPAVMQTYVVVMAFLVAGGTLFDIVHKKSATYFFNSWRDSTNKAKQQIGGAEMVDIAVRTAVVDVMASGEFCNMRRRVAHLLT